MSNKVTWQERFIEVFGEVMDEYGHHNCDDGCSNCISAEEQFESFIEELLEEREKEIEEKALQIAKRLYPDDTADWSERHKALAFLGEALSQDNITSSTSRRA